MVAFTFSPGPFYAALLITMLSYARSPYRNRSFHYSYAGSKREISYHTARPLLTLMARVVSS